MESITIYVKDREKIELLNRFLRHLDFVVMPDITNKQVSNNKEYDFFKSSGLWENRNVTIDDLRARAWKKQ
jgi:hypothetical protein